jgi:hypothetical protein
LSFFDLEVLKEKPIKPKRIIPHLKLAKNMFLGQNLEKQTKKCNSYKFMKIWSNFNHSKVLNY